MMVIIPICIVMVMVTGCVPEPQGNLAVSTGEIPKPLEQYLPESLKIHPFTKMGELKDGKYGIDAHIQAIDPWGEPTKAFGNFRIELYQFRKFHHEKKGKMVEAWDVRLGSAGENRKRWDHHTRSYHFMLGMMNRLTPGRRMILTISYQDNFTERLTVENTITSK